MGSSIYSVSQINKYIKNMFQNDYMLQRLEIRGEISNLKYHSSGHIYFTLKDENSAIKCVMFSQYARALSFRFEEGMQVVVSGGADVYERDGSYQIYVKAAKQDGIGNLYEEFEKLKNKLSELGMFDPLYKQPIPKFSKTIGVITAPTGAAVRDIIDVSKRRNPGVQIILFPAIVQGKEAPASIIEGIKALENLKVDVIILGRGGGSIEDLWGFNDEAVAQAIFDCSIPIISAVGHETDFTIADFVSDLRAPTPSAAAELANADVASLVRELRNKKELLTKDINHLLISYRQDIVNYGNRISLLSPVTKIKHKKEVLLRLKELLTKDFDNLLVERKHNLMLLAGRLDGLSPLKKLSSGYSFVTDDKGKRVKSINDLNVGDEMKVNVTDGFFKTKIVSKEGKDGR